MSTVSVERQSKQRAADKEKGSAALPGLENLRSYRPEWFLKDLGAGLVLTTLLVPVGMGYAQAAGLPPINGLYASIFPLLAYALFGSNRILVLGPDSSLAAIIAATIAPLGADSAHSMQLAAMLALCSGGLCVFAGALRFGLITDLLSTPVRYGYLNGIALTVLVGQLPKLLGFTIEGGNLIEELSAVAQAIASGKVNLVALSIGFSCLLVIIGCKFFAPRVPGVLISIVGATLTVKLMNLQSTVKVVGELPQGLPMPSIPSVSPEEMLTLLPGAVAIALVSFADMSFVSRKFAMEGQYEVDDNKELIALGATNIVSGAFQGFSVTSSASRTPVAKQAGAQSQVTCIVGAVCIAALLLAGPSLLADIPIAALGAVVVGSCLSLVEIEGVWKLIKLRSGELVSTAFCFLGVALVGILQGIFIATTVALLNFIRRAWQPYYAVLGRVDQMKGYHDVSRHPDARQIPGLLLFRWDAPIFFANARIFQDTVSRSVENSDSPVRWIVVTAEPVTDVDITAAEMLRDLDEELQKANIELCFAEMKGPVKDQLKKYGLFSRLGSHNFFPTIGKAVHAYLDRYKVDWKDWEDGESQ